MEYTEFSKDQQIQQVKSRIAAWESEHYANVLSLAAAEESKSEPEARQFKENLRILEASLKAGKEELARLGDSSS